jgi:hypothetical protein
MQIKARRCFVPLSPSDWVAKVFLTCDNKIAVQFKHGQHVKKILPHGPGAYLGHGGVPHVCCLYPGTQGDVAETLYELAQVWSYAGEWVHAFLYKKFGYVLVAPPAACGGCNTSCFLQSSRNPAATGDLVTFTATFTNTDGSPTKGDAPEGTADWYVDGVWVANTPVPPNDPDTQNWQTTSLSWTCGTTGTHTIEVVFNPDSGDFATTSCSLTQTCQGGISTACCPGELLPATLHATVSGTVAGTYALSYGGNQAWTGSFTICGGTTQITAACVLGSWGLTLTGSVAGWTGASPSSPPSCNPLQVVFIGTGSCVNNGSPVSLTITITE